MNKWEKEVAQHHLAAEEEVIKELEAQYKRALNEINLKIRILKGDELTQSKIYQINYQEALKGQIEGILEKLHGDEYTSIQQYLKECYTDGFIGTMYDIAGQGIPLMIPIDQNAAVKAIMTDSKINEGLYKAIGVDTAELKKRIRSEITRGLAANDTYESIAQSISLFTNAPLKRARTIVRTEGHRIQQASTEDARQAAKKRGCDILKVWDATMDGETRPTHRKLDGQIRETDELFEMDGKKAKYPGEFGRPEEDCNCRCTANSIPRWALDEAELEEQKERAKFFGIDKTEDFEDYKKKYLGVIDTDIDNKMSKPKRPKRSDYDDEDKYDEARAKYRKELESYKERLEKWADLQIPETAMTRSQIEEWCLKNNLELKDIDGMDKRAFNAFTQRWEKLSNDYPLNKKLHFSTGEILDNRMEIAFENDASFYADAGHGMSFGSIFKDYRKVLTGFGEQISDGFNVWGSGSINTLFDHEYGHSVYTSLKYSKGMTTDKRLKMKEDLISTCLGKKGISEYAQTNEEELFAEGFAAFYGGEKTEFAEAFKQFLGRWYK